MTTSPDFTSLPAPLAEALSAHWQRFAEVGGVLPDALAPDLVKVWTGSDYVAERMARSPELPAWLAEPGRLSEPLDATTLAQDIDNVLAEADDDISLQAGLRLLRHRHMTRIIWRDLCGYGDYHSTVADLSLLADTLIDAALTRLYQRACDKEGTPLGPDGQPVRLVVFAMGKLGARELNLSSDIDLIFAYEHEGDIEGHRRGMSHHQFFVRLGQALIRMLDQATADGFVFRVDMRLRPWGGAGALAIGFDAMEGYYEEQGREWERYAMVKIRAVAGDTVAGERMIRRLQPFVYRRYIDYGAFASLREMKSLIEREVRRKGIQSDVKLGPGGIREVEFIVQAFQLIRGGQLPGLRRANLLEVLPQLVEQDLLPEEVAEELRDAYVFLRNVEHRLQAVADRQTQRLPENEDGWARLALAMGFRDRRSCERALARRREQVRYHFSQVIADPESEQQDVEGADRELLDLWLGMLDDTAAVALLEGVGIAEPEPMLAQLEAFREGRAVANMQTIARERLDRLMPRLLETLGYQQVGPVTCERVLAFLEAVLRRSAYIALLVENPHALTQLVKLSGASPWIAEQMTRHPVLLDELLDARTLYSPPQRSELDDELRQQLLRVAEDDLEQQMEVLRHFKQAHLLRVAASEVTQVLPLMKVSDYLTWLAEAILHQVVQLAWKPLVARHGRPHREDGQPCTPDFVVVGYGKLGGIELGHNSDLDLVFLHDADSGGNTDGDKPVSNEQFFARLGQRIIHIITTRTMSGQLYEVDSRLRPSGSAGLLVSSMRAFEKYQRERAWTWEHQALVRARVVAGCQRARERFNAIREAVLCEPRDADALRKEVLAMREKMIQHLSSGDRGGRFHIKQDPGGIVDIEFMVQYGVLRWASQHSDLTRFTDNVRLLETLAVLDLMPAHDAGLLREAYLAFRSAAHRLALRNEPSEVDVGEFAELREGVRVIWDKWFA
ncbi:bifunctional [glutamate--ammonia ligase]-adenylyl-L-tyrosine phosphorylase/[glutamate--ammonia-ligase] adenylyltransferase [Alcanivorax sp. JB21]|uniref:bifunctional [glutamate--ammonia ligase]-adenylyl-L-tyrosine phosphorylase/[glutamate--ammonia-ligase] adenylyltransferase n=1 Tax=Alcanivorax limicola TaxID=2874102 RepID=UPI001CBAAEFD|nr:bifunctional [glutamate--ammonia ligase]-adenylyl-L-tyrosine phosphorylase/[glutamate--ammonia-ligase] adenylyltransferase [Alcanivorax limicola]MBZ2190310.1 bifunctional [glutamate--ammonia ligase]-adenylyl-L-tyrosine phosphorylase/[glutamate--ammonia-ligase] adenylyltransferase [Alcanivorax limicola]